MERAGSIGASKDEFCSRQFSVSAREWESGLFVARSDAPYVFDGLTSRALPLVVISALAGLGALLLLRARPHRLGRLTAVIAAGGLVLAWGVAQWDYLLPESLTVAQAAAPSGTIRAVLVAGVLAVLLIVPAFTLLYTLDQKGLLPEEGVDAESAGR